jgi:hypothetical protein
MSNPSTTAPEPRIGPHRAIVRAAPSARVRQAPSSRSAQVSTLPNGTVVLVGHVRADGEALPAPAVGGVDPRGDTNRAWDYLVAPVAGYVWQPLLGDVPHGHAVYTDLSPILAPTPDDPYALARAFRARCRALGSPYRDDELEAIGLDYATGCIAYGLDAAPVLAQVAHETGGLSSFWSLPPQCNPAGIGVTGARSDLPRAGYAYNVQRGQWEAGITFREWPDAIRAHLGRLLAYALPAGAGTPAQHALIAEALTWRSFPAIGRGTAQRWRELGRAHNPQGARSIGWASPGTEYGARIATAANALIWT